MPCCPHCDEPLTSVRRGRQTQLECNDCGREFNRQGAELIEVDDLVELYQEIGGEG